MWLGWQCRHARRWRRRRMTMMRHTSTTSRDLHPTNSFPETLFLKPNRRHVFFMVCTCLRLILIWLSITLKSLNQTSYSSKTCWCAWHTNTPFILETTCRLRVYPFNLRFSKYTTHVSMVIGLVGLWNLTIYHFPANKDVQYVTIVPWKIQKWRHNNAWFYKHFLAY